MADCVRCFVGKCPKCGSYHSCVRTEVTNFDEDAKANPAPVVSRTRIFLCNNCRHIWSETVPGPNGTGP